MQDVSFKNTWGIYQTKGFKTQDIEDTLVISELSSDDLTPRNSLEKLQPRQIAERLWTSLKNMAQPIYAFKSGTTAALAVFNGENSIITATLGDSVSFLVIYDKNNKAVSTTRLNPIIHSPDNVIEMQRISDAGGFIETENGVSYVNGKLNMTRSLGDAHVNRPNRTNVILSDAQIHITDCTELPGYKKGRKIQIIACSDGFTEPRKCYPSKQGQEMYLLRKLNANNALPGKELEDELASRLANAALDDGSKDHISVIVKTISENNPTLTAVFDGHGGSDSSVYAANHISKDFIALCAMPQDQYEKLPFSVANNLSVYQRDNADASLFKKHHLNDFNSILVNFIRIRKPQSLTLAPEELSYQDQCSVFTIFSIINKKHEVALNSATVNLVCNHPDLFALASVLGIFYGTVRDDNWTYFNAIVTHPNAAFLNAILFYAKNRELDFPQVLMKPALYEEGVVNYIFSTCPNPASYREIIHVKNKSQQFIANLYQLYEKNLVSLRNCRILLKSSPNEKLIYNRDLHFFKLGKELLLAEISSHYTDQSTSCFTFSFFQSFSWNSNALKINLLNEFKEELEECLNIDQFDACLLKIRASDNYKVLETKSAISLAISNKPTSFIQNLEQMIALRHAQLKEIEAEDRESTNSAKI